MNNLVALIPARAGSKRIPRKNIKNLGGHPLIAYSIQSAIDSGIFDAVYVSSDSEKTGEIAKYYGAEFIKRPEAMAADNSPDSDWIIHALSTIQWDFEYFAILRPTNPLRTAATIRRAWREWDKMSIMKAVESVSQHPGKMWRLNKYHMESFLPGNRHLRPTQSLETLFIQNASLEFRRKLLFEKNFVYQPFFTVGYEGFDINTENDWFLLEALIEKGHVVLPEIKRKVYENTI